MANVMICFTCDIKLDFVYTVAMRFFRDGQIKILENKQSSAALNSVGKIISICHFACPRKIPTESTLKHVVNQNCLFINHQYETVYYKSIHLYINYQYHVVGEILVNELISKKL